MKKSKQYKGLTLVELLLVITILGILFLLFALVAPSQLKKARDAKRKGDLEKIKTGLYDYYFDAGCFPKSLSGDFPCDPQGKVYGYQVEEEECSQWFKILTNLENQRDPGIDKVGCRSGCGPECQYNYGLSSTNIRVNQGCVAYFACAPGGECAEFEDPFISECPRIFENDSSCGGVDCHLKENRCHDSRGKRVPEE